jgi:hypothetical protein
MTLSRDGHNVIRCPILIAHGLGSDRRTGAVESMYNTAAEHGSRCSTTQILQRDGVWPCPRCLSPVSAAFAAFAAFAVAFTGHHSIPRPSETPSWPVVGVGPLSTRLILSVLVRSSVVGFQGPPESNNFALGPWHALPVLLAPAAAKAPNLSVAGAGPRPLATGRWVLMARQT